VQRLERAGLAPQRREAAVRRQPLTPAGTGFTIGRGELEVYLYADQSAREREQAALDSAAYVRPDQRVTLRNEPTLITSVNAIAVLKTVSDRQRERVADAFAAGPPQPHAEPQ
jgi:hypothetical protein